MNSYYRIKLGTSKGEVSHIVGAFDVFQAIDELKKKFGNLTIYNLTADEVPKGTSIFLADEYGDVPFREILIDDCMFLLKEVKTSYYLGEECKR